MFANYNKNKSVIITAIISLAIIEGIALLKGIDGVILTMIVGAISGLGGFVIGKNGK